MAGGNGKRGGADRVLESRHLVGLFLGVVLLCGVFFTLGYVMGRTQYGGAVHAFDSAAKKAAPVRTPEKSVDNDPVPVPAAPAPSSGDWDFYTKKKTDHLEPAAKPSSPAVPLSAPTNTATGVPPAAKTVPASATFQPPRMLKGAIVLQVAAVTHQDDALAMADALQRKKFPAFVVTPASDNFYRVQIGPYSDARAAESAKSALERAGFKAIIKR